MGAGAVVERHDGAPPGEEEIAARMRAEGLTPHGWGNGPGDTYGWHEHGYEKVLYCVRGQIVFHTASKPGPVRQSRSAQATSSTRLTVKSTGMAPHRSTT
jgi:hypothetical protein